ncbi:histone-lysine N-methyltransferase SETMAR [Trichonephila clavipes]|nr:histone-lysine N-methyltransferase SETMAR [Trichonephila clavipes]
MANSKGVVFHQDNASSHTSVVTRQKLWELGWEVLMHPPYSPDLAPSHNHPFLAFNNFLSDKKLGSSQDCENRLLEFFANKDGLRSSTIRASDPLFMSPPIRSQRCSMGIKSGKFASQMWCSNIVRLLRVRRNAVLGAPCNKWPR